MTDAEIQEVNNTMNTPGWSLVVGMIKESFLEGRKPVNIDTKNKTPELIGLEVMARVEAAKSMDKFLRKLAAMKFKQAVVKKVFK